MDCVWTATWRWPVPRTAWEEEIWSCSCSWCRAAAHVGGEWFELARPPNPRERHWEGAVADGLSDDVSRAFGIFRRTLCGIQEAGMPPSGYGWLPRTGERLRRLP